MGAEAAWEEQWREAEMWLLSAPEGYRAARLTATYHVDGTPSECLLWADPHQLVTLCQWGHLTLMDSTHESNWRGWSLFTVNSERRLGEAGAVRRALPYPSVGQILTTGFSHKPT